LTLSCARQAGRSRVGAREVDGEAKLSAPARDFNLLRKRLLEKARRLPFASRYREIVPVLFVADAARARPSEALSAKSILAELR
jgi:hypothetical protein